MRLPLLNRQANPGTFNREQATGNLIPNILLPETLWKRLQIAQFRDRLGPMLSRFWVALVLVNAIPAQNMPPTRPSIRGVFPHGAQRGTEVEITLRGKNL